MLCSPLSFFYNFLGVQFGHQWLFSRPLLKRMRDRAARMAVRANAVSQSNNTACESNGLADDMYIVHFLVPIGNRTELLLNLRRNNLCIFTMRFGD